MEEVEREVRVVDVRVLVVVVAGEEERVLAEAAAVPPGGKKGPVPKSEANSRLSGDDH